MPHTLPELIQEKVFYVADLHIASARDCVVGHSAGGTDSTEAQLNDIAQGSEVLSKLGPGTSVSLSPSVRNGH